MRRRASRPRKTRRRTAVAPHPVRRTFRISDDAGGEVAVVMVPVMMVVVMVSRAHTERQWRLLLRQ